MKVYDIPIGPYCVEKEYSCRKVPPPQQIDFHGSGGGQGLARGERVRQLVKAMEDAGMLTYRLSKFGGKLMDLVLVPLMVRDTHWINVVDSRNLIEIKFRKDQV